MMKKLLYAALVASFFPVQIGRNRLKVTMK